MSPKRSRVHPPYKTKYRVSNSAEYDRALINRGSITFWVSPSKRLLLWAWSFTCRSAKPKGSSRPFSHSWGFAWACRITRRSLAAARS